MSITQRMFELMETKGIKKAEFARLISCTPQAINNWRDRGTTPPMEYLPAICKALDISWEYLVTGEDATTTPHLTYDEEYLLKNYRLASDKGRGRIQECAREMVQLYPALPNDLEGILTVLEQKKIQKAGTIKPVTDDNVVGYAMAGTGIVKPNTEVAKKADIPNEEE